MSEQLYLYSKLAKEFLCTLSSEAQQSLLTHYKENNSAQAFACLGEDVSSLVDNGELRICSKTYETVTGEDQILKLGEFFSSVEIKVVSPPEFSLRMNG